ncbi:MAG TPA: DUF6515 family protein [Niabella sp.]|nr:DUF6515 family protein [Niabella sp.]HOZ97692.1 DUF6515 family protein [Niabella sp.]HQW13998.1 DUF6515 family protein [Niabella sp.]HQX19459.1 DUF6515 family protein [Niabella sp.]HQX40188.1 DUF6515 family protein [Niabella sp.]
MKKLFIPIFLVGLFLVLGSEVNAQRRYHHHRSMSGYRPRPHVMISLGTAMGGIWGSGYWGYGWGPRVGFNIVIPPSERRVHSLPLGAEKRIYGGIAYYYRNNTFYREGEDGDYQMVAPPLGAVVDRIPMSAKLRKIEGRYYYESGGVYYQMNKREDGRPEYTIVGKDGELRLDEAYQNQYDQEEDAPERYNKNDFQNSNPINENTPIVKNGNEKPEVINPVLPQVGDRFEQLPKNCKEVSVNGESQFVSPNGVYYKKQTNDGETFYEVVKSK